MSIRLLAGDCRDVLATLPANSVQCVVTSPPYYGLRDYGTATWSGGDAGCNHAPTGTDRGARDELPKPPAGWAERAQGYANGRYCTRCGARRIDAQLGLESSPDAYIATMVGVFREVRRVLRDDGTCWVNMGDSYAGGYSGRAADGTYYIPKTARSGDGHVGDPFWSYQGVTPTRTVPGLKPKDLLMMPARLALALQADGWWLRSDIIWHKPNPMPESCRDRPTSAHEHVFLLTKRARYFYDSAAIAEPATNGERFHGAYDGGGPNERTSVSNGRDRLSNTTATRSCRNVWTIATHAYPQAHFATFPPELAERCIKAGTSERGCCAQCGAPWVREVASTGVTNDRDRSNKCDWIEGVTEGGNASGIRSLSGATYKPQRGPTGTWLPSCACDAGEPVPCTVLDPFAGAGTTLLVADRLQRHAIGIDLNVAYTQMAMERVRADAPLFVDINAGPVPEHPVETQIADLFAEAAE